jgi:hypothetical protein
MKLILFNDTYNNNNIKYSKIGNKNRNNGIKNNGKNTGK